MPIVTPRTPTCAAPSCSVTARTRSGSADSSGDPSMARVEERLQARGLVLPPPIKVRAGLVLPFQFVRVVGRRAFIAGHGPQGPDGAIAPPFGKVGREVTLEQGNAAARLTALAILGSLERALGDLDRIAAWCR